MATAKKAEGKTYYVRLKRHGSHQEKGLKTFVFKSRKYTRIGIYKVPEKLRNYMMATGVFETILPEDLPRAKAEAKRPRGVPISDPKAPGRARRRTARAPRTVDDGVAEVDVDAPGDAPEPDDEGGVDV